MPCRVVVLGAGISGLTYAWYLKQRWGSSVNMTLLEKTERVGGWIRTTHADEFLFEHGPRSCRTTGSGIATLRLIEDLGLQDQVIVGDRVACNRYLYVGGKLQKFPGLLLLPFSSLTRDLIPALFREYFVTKGLGIDESVYSFFSRRLNRDLTERFIDPLVSGIYAGDLNKLSMRACFPSFYSWEQEYGSIVKGLLWSSKQKNVVISPFVKSIQKSPIFSFKNGMETLVQELANQLKKEIRLRCFPQAIEMSGDKIKVKLENREIIEADFVFSAIPMAELGRVLNVPFDLKQRMGDFPYSSVVVVNLGYRKHVLKQKGFGYLIPSKEQEDILGCVWDSSIFPEQNEKGCTRLTVMMKGTEESLEETYVNRAIKALERHLNIRILPDRSMVFVAREAIPQYEIGYLDLKKKLQDHVSVLSNRLILAGSAFSGVSVNDCIANSYEKALRYLDNIK